MAHVDSQAPRRRGPTLTQQIFIGLALGISHRKDGRFSSFVLGSGVIFAYYVVLWTSRAAAR